jgi:hypothetical protein
MIPTIGQYTWLGKPRLGNENGDKHGGVGFLIRNTLVDLSQVITDTSLHDSIWLKIHGTRGTQDMFIGCVYMPVEGSSNAEVAFAQLTEDIARFQEQGHVVIVGDFNARVGRSPFDADIIGKFGEQMSPNRNGKSLIK